MYPETLCKQANESQINISKRLTNSGTCIPFYHIFWTNLLNALFIFRLLKWPAAVIKYHYFSNEY